MPAESTNKKKSASASPMQPTKARKPRGRRWWETAAIAVSVIAVATGAYYGFYVTKRGDQLTDYYSRSLASSAGIVRQAIEGLRINVCNARGDRGKLKMIAGLKVPEPARSSDAGPESDGGGAVDDSECRTTYDLDTVALWDHGSSVLDFRREQDRLGQMPLATLLSPALPVTDFDAVLLARGNGEVLVSAGVKSLSIVRLRLDSSPGAASSSADPEPAGVRPNAGDRYTMVTDYPLGGRTYKMFVQPVRIPIELRWAEVNSDMATTVERAGLPSEDVWVIAGLLESSEFRFGAMAISPTVLLVAFGVGVVALLSLPYLKLRFLGRREAMQAHDVLVLISALLIGTSITTLAVLEFHARAGLEAASDRRLQQLSVDIALAFRDEVACLDTQLRELTGLRAGEPPMTRTDILNPADGSILTTYPFLEMAYWVAGDGWQMDKWTVQSQATQSIRIATRDYFIRARDRSFMTKEPRPCVPVVDDKTAPAEQVDTAPADGVTRAEPGYFIESIRSRTTGAVNTVLSQRLKDEAEAEDGDEGRAIVAAALAPLLSVTDAVVPPGFEFAVIDREGTVVFHHDSGRNLRENFFDELGDPMKVRAEAWSRATRPIDSAADVADFELAEFVTNPIDVDYRARTYRMSASRLGGTPWSLVTLYDVSTYRIARAEVLTFALAVSLIYTVILIAVFALLHVYVSRRYRSSESVFHLLWPTDRMQGAYSRMLRFSLAAGALWLLVMVSAPPLVSAALSGILGLITFVFCFGSLHTARSTLRDDGRAEAATSRADGPPPSSGDTGPAAHGSDGDGARRHATADSGYGTYARAIVSAIVVMSVLPPAAFYRAANDEIMELFVMGDQLRLADELQTRVDRIHRRYRNVAVDEDAASRMRDRLFPAGDGSGKVYDVHTAGWVVGTGPTTGCQAGEPIRQPIVGFLAPRLVGIVQQSWEIRSLADDRNGRWYRGDRGIVLVDDGYDTARALAGPGTDAGSGEDRSLRICAGWPGLLSPGTTTAWSLIILVLGIALGAVALWTVTRSMVRLVFLTELREPRFLAVRDWSDLEDCPRALVLRDALEGAPEKEGIQVVRMNASLPPDESLLADLEMSETAASTLVIVERFHWGLWDSAIAEEKLALLERLLTLDCRLVIHSEVNPLHYLTMVAEDHFRGVAPVMPDLGRWSAALARLRRCRTVPDRSRESRALLATLSESREKVVESEASKGEVSAALERIANECWPNRYLEDIALRMARHPGLAAFGGEDGEELVSKQVLDQSEAYYRMLWSISGKDERMVLYRLATTGFASWRSRELVRRLIHRGLVYLDPAPRLMNESFRQFVVNAEDPGVLEQWTAEEGASPWARLRTPVIVAVIGIFLFLFATQPQLFSQSLAFTTAIAAVVPTLVKLISLIGGTRTASAS